jgi:DNA polymerase-3 subunit delta'
MDNEIVKGHDFQKSIIKRAAGEGLVSHSYLFSGLDGIGKKLVATEFAKLINCANESPGSIEGCQCGSCAKVDKGIHPDVIYVKFEGVKSIKVEQIREGVENRLFLRPYEGKYKVVIVDEAHRMSHGAQNAFLKTLEEPPANSVIILITSNPDSLLPTIRSRCQIIRFHPLPKQLILHELEKRGELTSEQSLLCAKLSRGSLGKAISLDSDTLRWREELIQFIMHLKPHSAMRVIGLAEYMPLSSLPEDVEKMTAAFEFILLWLRDLLLIKSGGNEDLITNIDLIEQSREIAASLNINQIADKLIAVETAWNDIYNLNANKQLCFENLFIRLAS